MKLKEKINMNIRDDVRSINIKGVDIKWKFSLRSLYILLYDFDYETENKLMKKLQEASTFTLIQVFYSGIVWEDEDDKPEFKDFLIFLDIENTKKIEDFINKNIEYFLYPKKKEKDKDKKIEKKEESEEGVNFDSLLLISRINLKITEEEFWNYSPRKFFALLIEYNELHSSNAKEENKEKGNADDLDKLLKKI